MWNTWAFIQLIVYFRAHALVLLENQRDRLKDFATFLHLRLKKADYNNEHPKILFLSMGKCSDSRNCIKEKTLLLRLASGRETIVRHFISLGNKILFYCYLE